MFTSPITTLRWSKVLLVKGWLTMAYRILIFVGLSLLVTSCTKHESTFIGELAPINLKVGEGFVNPLGYYEAKPRFSWQLSPKSKQLLQTSYQVQVASTDDFSTASLVWDSGKVASENNAWIRYSGEALNSRQRVYWRVRTWGQEHKVSDWSDPQFIELGLLNNNDWQAKWIGHPDTEERYTNPSFNGMPAVDHILYRPQYLRADFKLDKPVKKARLYITAKGVFKPYINGKSISKDVMTPGWTPYHKRIETLTYDVSSEVKRGANTIAAALAEGWHTGRIFHPTQQEHVKPMRLLAQLEIVFDDGTTQIITTDENWRSTNQGPIRKASNYDGETYDANMEMPGWNQPNFKPASDTGNNSDWSAVYAEPIDYDVKLKPKRHKAPRATLAIPAIDIVSVKNGVAIFDMGQNMVGVPEINVPAKKGQTIKLRFSEALQQDEFYVKNLRSAKNIDLYTPSQDGEITYRPTFTFHGYRFVEISGYDDAHQPELSWLTGMVVHSDFDVYDNFTSNHSKLNKLSDNVAWGLRGNFLDVPTDCPQRDERLGWTGDAQVFVSTSMYKADVYAFWAAWLESVREEQSIDGMIPKFVPFRSFLTDGTAAAWGDAATIVPWELYQYTGDTNVLSENYTMMKRWVEYTEFNSFNHISNIGTYGDWLQPYSKNGRAKGDTHPDLIATAYYAKSVDITAKTARLLGYKSDAMQYERLFNNIKSKFRDYFFDENLNLVSSATKTIKREKGKRLKRPKQSEIKLQTTQTSYLLPLSFNLFNEKEQQVAVSKLLTLLEQSDKHLRTGFLGTPMLYQVLQRYGHSDVMYDILLKETYPSWFYSINHGATTTWERWNSYSLTEGYNKANMNSLNHYAYGAVAQWFYNGMLGIQATQPGFKTFKVEPQFTDRLNDLSGSVPTVNGDIKVRWSIKNNQLNMSLSVPSNSQAELLLPMMSKLEVTRNGSLVNDLSALVPGEYQISGHMAL